jgi:Flp pilus assembly protein TadD
VVPSITSAERHPEQKSRRDLTWDIAAGLLLACSVTMLTDFSRRMLGSDPDSLGIVSVSVQAVFAVAATSTFTKAGWQWIESLFSDFKIGMRSQSRWRLALSAVLFAIMCPIWIWLPSRLAVYYNDRGVKLEEANPVAALEDLERSTALNPRLSAAQYNLGELLEESYQYDAAASRYQQSIGTNNRDIKSYNNLARVLLLDGNAMTALSITDQALTIGTTDKQALAALYKNRGSAEFDLGFNTQAIADSLASENSEANAAAYCLLGQIYTKTGKAAHARTAWEEFDRLRASSDQVKKMAAPDCTLRAEEYHATN